MNMILQPVITAVADLLDHSGMIRVSPAQIRWPDVSFISCEHFPNRKLPWEHILELTPDLAVKIHNPSNTVAEMDRKRGEYFTSGAKLVWEVDPAKRTVAAYTSPDDVTILEDSSTVATCCRASRCRFASGLHERASAGSEYRE